MTRHITPSDAPHIALIQLEAWNASLIPPLEADAFREMTVELRTAKWIEMLQDRDWKGLLVELEEPVAFSVFGRAVDSDVADSQVAEIFGFHVKPTQWRQGIGRELMVDTLLELTHLGFSSCVAWVFSDNTPARSFYEQMGFNWDNSRKEAGFGLQGLRYRRSNLLIHTTGGTPC